MFFEGFKKVFTEGKAAIDANKVVIEKHSLPTDTNLKEQTCRIVENVAFLAEFALYFPDYVAKIFESDKSFKELYDWSFKFARNLSLYDERTNEMLDLAGQELFLLPRQDDFVNPYSKELRKEELMRIAVEKYENEKKLKKKEKSSDAKLKRNKGLKLSHNEF